MQKVKKAKVENIHILVNVQVINCFLMLIIWSQAIYEICLIPHFIYITFSKGIFLYSQWCHSGIGDKNEKIYKKNK